MRRLQKIFYPQLITFKFKEWKDKLPVGICTECIGDVRNSSAWYKATCYKYNIKLKSIFPIQFVIDCFKNGRKINMARRESRAGK